MYEVHATCEAVHTGIGFFNIYAWFFPCKIANFVGIREMDKAGPL